ncbi:hypothetical protein BK141_05805 [Paenibacillus sp. FSL R5-0765]|nr:hypothetical protein BK141_05805 [Paenibacillus sp. FSL R5-0765]
MYTAVMAGFMIRFRTISYDGVCLWIDSEAETDDVPAAGVAFLCLRRKVFLFIQEHFSFCFFIHITHIRGNQDHDEKVD